MNKENLLSPRFFIFFGLVVILGTVYFFYDHSIDESDRDVYKTKRAIGNLNAAVRNFYSDVGRYPLGTEGLDVLVTKTNGFGPYVDHVGVDTWGNRYIYKISSSETEPFLIYSAGKNGVDDNGEADDIK